MKVSRYQGVLLAVLLLSVSAAARAESARGLVRRGNKAYEAGHYDEAMKAYEQADVESPESPVVIFNQGAVHYRAEDYVAARDCFEKAAKMSRDPAFEAECRYNVGGTWFKEARRQLDSDLKKAVEACERSVDNYQAALALQPGLEAARRNIEIVRRLWKSILDEQKKRQEEQKAQQEQQQKFAEEMKQLIERQEQAAEQSAALGQKQATEGSSPPVQEQAHAQAKDQRQLGQDTQAAADKLAQMLSAAPPPQVQPGGAAPSPAPPPPTAPAQEQMQQARQLQEQAAEKLDQTQPTPASADQKQAAEALRKALESLSQPQDGQKQEQPGQQGQEDQKQEEGKDGQKQEQPDQEGQDGQKQEEGKDGQKQEEQKQQASAAKEGAEGQESKDQKQVKARLADQEARDILDDEKRNRDRRTAAEQQGVAPVDKDW